MAASLEDLSTMVTLLLSVLASLDYVIVFTTPVYDFTLLDIFLIIEFVEFSVWLYIAIVVPTEASDNA